MLLPNYSGKLLEAGLDEAGRGCLAGPVVAAAVILPHDYRHKLLNDSKQVTRKNRDILREEICKEAVQWAIGVVSHEEIDRINILNASFLAMHRAVDLFKVKPEFLIIDGNRFCKYFGVPHACIVKGDEKYLSIAAASILAKTYRDELMEELAKEFPVYGWEHNAGYATIKHRKAITEFGSSPYHRLSFKLAPEPISIEF